MELKVINPMKVLLNAFQYDIDGVSESFLAAKWHQCLAKHCNIDVVSSNVDHDLIKFNPSNRWLFSNELLNRVNSAVKFDYFYFNYKSERLLRERIKDYDVFHHVSPVAPRYPVSLGQYANKFILGPIAGGLRAPESFRSEVEGSEEFFLKARNVDSLRFKADPTLRKTYESATKILVAGQYLESVIPARFHHKFKSFLDVGVDVNEFSFIQRTRGEGKLKLIYVGRVVPYKGLIYLLKALAALPQNIHRNIELVVVGDRAQTTYELDCYKFVEENYLHNVVTFKGYVSKAIVNKLYDKSHIFCFPSLAEAGGTVVVEALSKGLPVIAANVGGPAESVNETCGYLVETYNPICFVEALKDAIEKFYYDATLISVLSKGARERAEKLYDWDARGKLMANIYAEN